MADEVKIPRHVYSPLFWANAKALWETGSFATAKEFKEYGDKTFKSFPKLAVIQKRMAAEHWDKDKQKRELDERIENSYADLFEKEGCGDVETVRRICLGIKAPERTVKAITEFATANKGKIDDETLKKFADMMNYDLRTAIDYIIERNKMVGGYAASKHKITGKLTAFDTKNMTPEEAAAEHERIHRNFVDAGLCNK
jgi:hypothetical protein